MIRKQQGLPSAQFAVHPASSRNAKAFDRAWSWDAFVCSEHYGNAALVPGGSTNFAVERNGEAFARSFGLRVSIRGELGD